MTMQTSPISLNDELENREAIKFLDKKGMNARQIRFLKYLQIDPNKKIIYFEKEPKRKNARPRRKAIRYEGTAAETIINRAPVSKMFVLYKLKPYKCFQRSLSTLMPMECFYSVDEIEKICRPVEKTNTAPIYFRDTKGQPIFAKRIFRKLLLFSKS